MNTEELKAAYASLPSLPDPITIWDEHRHTLRSRIASDYPARFMRWKPIRGTIAIRCDGYILDELAELEADERDWSDVIAEPGFGGNPHICECGASGTLIHQAYHLKQWLDKSDRDVSELESVFEIGPGFGAMAVVLERLGFTGTYFIHDLPEMAILCQYYLSNIESQVEPIATIPAQADLVIALHSWNEMPMEERHRVERVKGDSYLITYKGVYDGMDNTGYFEQFRQSRPELEWHHWQPTYRKGGRWYLVGVKTE